MQLAYSFLAEAAEVVPPSGRFFIFNGGVETISCAGFPGLIPSLAYVGKIRILPVERDVVHYALLRCLRPTGELLFPPLESDFDPRVLASPRDRPADHLLVANYRGVQIHEYGEHRFILACDGQELGSVSFFVDPPPDNQTQHMAPEGGNA